MEDHHSIQDNTQVCPNCDSVMSDTATFCQSCGQKNNTRLTVLAFISQFLSNVFNLDSKIFRTIGSIFIPGKLTNAFLKGQRKKYIHPIRLFLVFIIVSIAVFSFQKNLTAPGNLKKEHIDRLKERKKVMSVLDMGIDSIAGSSNQAIVQETLDSLSNVFYRNSGSRVDSINLNKAMRLFDEPSFFVALDDIGKYTPEEILEVYEVKGFWNRLKVRQKIKMIEKDTSFVPFVLSKVTWSVFIVLLLLTLIFRILYFRSDFLYLEHLIFGLHLNCFFLIIASILLLIPENKIDVALPFGLLTMAIYLFIAMKRVYKQGYFKTILKWIIVVVCYFISFIFGMVITIIGSFLLF